MLSLDCQIVGTQMKQKTPVEKWWSNKHTGKYTTNFECNYMHSQAIGGPRIIIVDDTYPRYPAV